MITLSNRMVNQNKSLRRILFEIFLKNGAKAHKENTTVSCVEMSGEFKYEGKTFKFNADLDVHFDEINKE